ncbi:MAG: LacI family transcriptional regulator [Opitutaceae bacterium]|nr:LacI family transcriptional regulator [Opitutaceae bacterium]
MTKTPRKRATLTEIAAKAGTSAATVSYVLNEKGAVGTETRARVLSAARALGYQTRPRASRSGAGENGLKNLTLVWVNTSPRWQQSWLSSLLSHTIATSLQAFGGRLHTVFCNEADHTGQIVTGEEDALLVAGRPGADFCKKLPARFPRLNIICQPYPTGTSFIDIDHISTGRSLTRHLIAHGHRRIGFVSNDRDHPYFEQLYIGYLHALDEARIPLQPAWVLRRHDAPSMTIETSEPIETLDSQLGRLIKKIGTPCALLAANDWIAGAIYQYAQRTGLRIPDHVSVAGCDNDPNICNLLTPGLTTCTVPYEEVGREAVHWLRAIVAGTPPHRQPGTLLLRGHVVERQSVATM